ncbi:MAG: glycosyltransferase family 2 protein [Rickettsiaceae bacterium]
MNNILKIQVIFNDLENLSKLKNNQLISILVSDYNVPIIFCQQDEIVAINEQRISEYYQNGYFFFQNKEGNTCLAINRISNVLQQKIESLGNIDCYLVMYEDFNQILQSSFAHFNKKQAVQYLSDNTDHLSARNIDYIKALCGFLVIFFMTIISSIYCFNIINNLLYIVQNVLKLVLFQQGLSRKVSSYAAIELEDLPIYSVLIPLYKEELKVNSILAAMANLNYPKHKLDVKLILEADDLVTIRSLVYLTIPDYIQIIKVPYSLPRTKPKALNYAMSFVYGQYLTIYDAEDEPDPDQLIKAIAAFRQLPQEYACVQAKLNFYNAKENLLTRLFSIEYSIWFNYVLEGLSRLNLPITLGGTSNHFKVALLNKVGRWDAYNVTEDAELGVRLHFAGYKVFMIDSTTLEEAPNKLTTWLNQRTRWIKGYLQTVCVFMKTKQHRDVNTVAMSIVYILLGLSTYSFLLLPWLLLVIWYCNVDYYIQYLWLTNSFCAISYMYAMAYIIISDDNSPTRIRSILDLLAFLIWPMYFILHTLASYKAIWELVISPFKWNKTPHGNIDLWKI